MSAITGAGFASGAIGAGVNEAVITEIKKIKDPGTAQIVSAIVGAVAAKAAGGNATAGAVAAQSGTRNNAQWEDIFRALINPEEVTNLVNQEISSGNLPIWQEMKQDYYIFSAGISLPLGRFITGAIGGILDKKGNVYVILEGGGALGVSSGIQITAGFGNFSGKKEGAQSYKDAIAGLSLAITGAAGVQGSAGWSTSGVVSGEVTATSGMGSSLTGRYVIFIENLAGEHVE